MEDVALEKSTMRRTHFAKAMLVGGLLITWLTACVDHQNAIMSTQNAADDRSGKFDHVQSNEALVDAATGDQADAQAEAVNDAAKSAMLDSTLIPDLGFERDLMDAASTHFCELYDSEAADYSPIQTTGAILPDTALSLVWSTPTLYTQVVPFSGNENQAASHEGIDYIHSVSDVQSVPITAAADGDIVYVRTGCPQSGAFSANVMTRECGSGWGNHVVIQHTDSVYTRYAHLDPNGITARVGQQVVRGALIGLMGNSGRSELRHLHFELGTTANEFNACEDSQSFERVFDPASLGL